jgi:hypothetical protein
LQAHVLITEDSQSKSLEQRKSLVKEQQTRFNSCICLSNMAFFRVEMLKRGQFVAPALEVLSQFLNYLAFVVLQVLAVTLSKIATANSASDIAKLTVKRTSQYLHIYIYRKQMQ